MALTDKQKKTSHHVQPFGLNLRHVTMAPEDVDPLKLYTFNVNPENQFDDYKNSRYLTRYKDIAKQWSTTLSELASKSESFSTKLWMETKNGRIHFHGVIQIHNPLMFDIIVLPLLKSMCSYEIDSIGELDRWLEYCTKQHPLWRDSKIESFITIRLTNIDPLKRHPLFDIQKVKQRLKEKGIFIMEDKAKDPSTTGTEH